MPGKQSAGSGEDTWTWKRVDDAITEAARAGGTIVLPLATIVETGNHIAHAPDKRFEHATAFCKHLKDAIGGTSPWVTFKEQSSFWADDKLLLLLEAWPALATTKISFADATIKHVADYYSEAGFDVTILTADRALRAYEPARAVHSPRRNS